MAFILAITLGILGSIPSFKEDTAPQDFGDKFPTLNRLLVGKWVGKSEAIAVEFEESGTFSILSECSISFDSWDAQFEENESFGIISVGKTIESSGECGSNNPEIRVVAISYECIDLSIDRRVFRICRE